MNVPGPAIPLYLDGARMTYFSAIMPIADGMGLVFSVTSYDGMIFISPTSCREQLPDPEFFAQCIRDSFQEYLLAVADEPRRSAEEGGAAKKPAAKRKAAAEAQGGETQGGLARDGDAPALARAPGRARAAARTCDTPCRPSRAGRTAATRPRPAPAGPPGSTSRPR